jgi:hypothetical protein
MEQIPSGEFNILPSSQEIYRYLYTIVHILKQMNRIHFNTWYSFEGRARGSVVGWGTMLKSGRSQVRVPMRWIFLIYLILPDALWPFGRLSLLTEMSTRKLLGA